MENRRDFLRLSAAGLALAMPGVPLASPTEAPPAGADGDGPTRTGALVGSPLLSPLEAGSELGFGWLYARSFPPHAGGLTVNLVHRDGRAARIDLCRLDGPARGPAHTALCDLLVMDGGDGAAPMDEELGRVVTRLAAIVAENEAAHPEAIDALVALRPHADRLAHHPMEMAFASRHLSPGADPS